jgi:hypothetical protein
MTISELKERDLILYECISGSRAYGLELPTSDTDIKGVFYLPKDDFYTSKYISQIANETNDIVYYEIGRLIELLGKNNPNILELLATPEDKILVCHPIFEKIRSTGFLSKLCYHTFGGYAFQQVKKARGLNKKIVNPVEKEKKTVLDFCHVTYRQGSMPVSIWLSEKNIDQSEIGLMRVPHFKDVYGMYRGGGVENQYKGIIRKNNTTSVLISPIEKNAEPINFLCFNEDGYIKYCKDYTEYWKWVEERNEERYQNNISHSKNYDSKNLMHTFRLLDMAYEILNEGKIIVKRPNREELLRIRSGHYEYDELIDLANKKMELVKLAFENSKLPDVPNISKINELLLDVRKELYEKK